MALMTGDVMKTKSAPRENRIICIRFPENHDETLNNPTVFRAVIDDNHQRNPEMFPPEIIEGYELKEIRTSKKMAITVRRILIDGVSHTVRPSFVMPYMTGLVRDVETPLSLRKWSVPCWALSQAFGKNAMCQYRLETSPGRNSLVSTTVK
jgi:hypothetical protein